LYYLSARSYDPKTHQFLSKDLSRNDGEQSAYQYCTGNPVNRVDPTGLMVAEYQSVSQAQLKQDQEALFYYELYASFRAKYAKSIIHQSQHKAKVVYIGWKESTSALGNSKGGATHAQISPAESDGAYGNYSASLGVYDAKGSHSVSLDISWAYGSEGVHVTSNNEPRAGKGGEGGWVKGTLSGFPYFDGPDDGRGFIGRVMGKWENKGFGCSESTYWMTAAVGIRGDTVYVYRPVISHELYIDPGHPEAGEVQVNEPPREAPVWETP